MAIPRSAPALLPRTSGSPCARVLSNGAFLTLLTADGTGFSEAHGQRLTGCTPDAVEGREGLLLYLRDEDDGRVWSVARAPLAGAPERYEVSAAPGSLSILRSELGVEAACEVVVSGDADVELRRIRLHNPGARTRRISVTTYLGLVLNHAGAHAGHPAFSKLFLQTSADPERGVLLARRRPRGAEPASQRMAHALFGPGEASFETDRARFVGRGRSLERPAALDAGTALSGALGNVLDPALCIRRTLTLAPGASAELVSVLAVAASEVAVRDLALRFAPPASFAAARASAAKLEGERLARCGLEAGQGEYLQALLAAMLYGAPSLRAPEAVLRRVRGTADDLWMFGLPPDRPLVVVEGGAELAAEAGRAAVYWAALGVPVSVLALGQDAKASDTVSAPKPDCEPRFLDSARAWARLLLGDEWPALALRGAPAGAARYRPAALEPPPARPERPLRFDNGLGGFAPGGREYVIDVASDGRALPPMPWINVLANPRFGALVSERGAAHSWSRNSQQHRLTPWSNDPIVDPHGEALWLRDEEARVFWSPQPGPAPAGGGYEVRHGFGYSEWRHTSHELAQEVTSFVALDAPLKITRIRITNRSGRPRRLSLFGYARLVLGMQPGEDARAIVVDAAADGRLLRATNGMAGVFADGVAFAAAASDAADAQVSFTADRERLLGAGGSTAQPRALGEDAELDGKSGARLDACFAQQLRFTLPPGSSVRCVLLLGEAESAGEADALAARFGTPDAADAALAAVRAHWEELLGALQVTTPSPALDLLVNGWLVHQTLSCRMLGRTAFYQSGGAWGFRDQLQDAAALVHHRPDLTRAQILLHAAHQFAEGDVQHWWHPPQDRGTRTRFSDDLLWLPYLTAGYVSATGDRALLDERAGFVAARALEPGEDEAYLFTSPAAESASVYEHCCRAIERSLALGAHGLPLMGTGDWNDGMNLVGREGRGESVWLAFFLYDLLRQFEPLAASRGDAARAARWAAHREALSEALEANAWDGAWYRRAYFDDGTKLGTASARECRIDVLPQAWSVLSGAVPQGRAATAMDAVERELLLPEGGLIRLLAPPFDRMQPTPGYIQGYVPGIRENGGQYTHGASWAVRAMAELGRRDRALAWFEMIAPMHHTRTPAEVAVYQVEPYVVVADLYAAPPHVGRGGWTWYTGSAGWMLRVALESLLGLRMQDGQRLLLRPCVPDGWPSFRIDYRVPGGNTRYAFDVRNPSGCSARVVSVRVDGAPLAPVDGAAVIPISHDAVRHEVVVELGA